VNTPRFPAARFAALVPAILLVSMSRPAAVTRTPSADGQFWDIQDTSPWSQDSGGIATGGRAMPFNGFGYLKLQVRGPRAVLLAANRYLTRFGLAADGAGHFDSVTPVVAAEIVVSRAIFAPPASDYLRYVDTFMNASDEERSVEVAWGGAVGAFDHVEWRSAGGRSRHVRDADAERAARRRSDARAVRSRAIGARARERARSIRSRRRHVCEPV
jgi:hypothetical protein